MTVKSAATGIITISALAGNAPVLYDFTSLQTVTVGSGGQTTITFSSIPPTYTHLQIRWLARENTGAQADPSQNIRIRFNSDTGSNYSIHRLYGLGSGSGVADGYASQSDIVSTGFPGSGNTASVFGAGIIDIVDYTNVYKNKTARSLAGVDINGTGAVWFCSGAWYNTAAINSIELRESTYGFGQYSSFALYGIK